jgi:chemotaxis protein CheX
MSPACNQEIVNSIVVQVTEELFAAYEVKVQEQAEPAGDPGDEVLFAGVIGFTGSAMRGTLVLAPTRKLLERSHATTRCEFRDWAGELANQLLGRIKNRLRAYGVEIHVSTPVLLKGTYLASIPRGELSLRCFAASPGNVSVWFDAEVSDGICFAEPEPQNGPSEGDTIIF